MDNKVSTNYGGAGGVSAAGLLGVAFVILKLCGVIDWSWWWVTAPFWGGFAIVIIILAILLFASAIIGRKERRSNGRN